MNPQNSFIGYAVFLRGINVGGHKKVPMAELRTMLEKNGFEDVKTLLASGNVLCRHPEKNPALLKKKFEALFHKTFGFTSNVIVHTVADLKQLIASHPFKGITVTPETRLYVTFLGTKPTSSLSVPYTSPDKDFQILSVTDTEIISVLQISATTNSVGAMAIIEKEYGKDVTTRNWNTLQKMIV